MIIGSGCTFRTSQSYHAPWNEQLSIAYRVATAADPTVFLFNVTASPTGLYSQGEPIRAVFRFQTSTGQSIDVTLLDKTPKQSAKLVDMTGYDERRNTRRFLQALQYVRVSPAEALTIAGSNQVRSTYDLTDRQPSMSLLLADDVPSSIGVPAVWSVSWTNASGNQIIVWIDAQTGTIIDIDTHF